MADQLKTTENMFACGEKKSAIDQICFTNESPCIHFMGHFLKPDICTQCMKELAKHSREAVKNEECVLKALEYTQKGEMVPTMILSRTEFEGAVYLGGFKAAVNTAFLKEENVTHIVNAAGKKLGMMFGPKFRENVKKVRETLNITALDLEWEDSMSFNISDDDFCSVVEFIDAARKFGSVLIHCAQGKSRSGTAVCAYLMAKQGMEMLQAIEFMQEKRKMIDPNPNFRLSLVKLERSEAMKRLREMLRG